jgi:hypothetical protein
VKRHPQRYFSGLEVGKDKKSNPETWEKEIMKKALTLLGILAVVGVANATVRVFVTSSSDPYGLENPANHMTPTVSSVDAGGSDFNTYDYYSPGFGPGPLRVGAFPPSASPAGTDGSPIQIPSGGFGYIWLQYQSEPAAKINGLNVLITDPSSPDGLAHNVYTTYYLCNNVFTTGNKRWDGTATPPGYPEWHNNTQTMVAVTAYGIKNLVPVLGEQFWSGAAAGRIALLGAVDAPSDGSIYHVDITLINYADTAMPTPSVTGGVFQFVPEPTSLLLLGLAGLLIRRR